MVQLLLKLVSACGLLMVAATTAFAQTQSSSCLSSGKPGLVQVASLIGCPFSAVIENETSHPLADGTHVHKKFKAMIYRDSSGRTRYESYPPTDSDEASYESPNLVFIVDPVAGYRYYLMPERATATRILLNEPSANPSTRNQLQYSFADESASESQQKSRPAPVTERLGTKEMQGLGVTGRRETYTIPAGAEGNDRPLVIVSETWYSSEMGITLLDKRVDPRTGETEKRVTNLKQTEPDPALFQIPPNYTIKGE
jgi:hypothetical protein